MAAEATTSYGSRAGACAGLRQTGPSEIRVAAEPLAAAREPCRRLLAHGECDHMPVRVKAVGDLIAPRTPLQRRQFTRTTGKRPTVVRPRIAYHQVQLGAWKTMRRRRIGQHRPEQRTNTRLRHQPQHRTRTQRKLRHARFFERRWLIEYGPPKHRCGILISDVKDEMRWSDHGAHHTSDRPSQTAGTGETDRGATRRRRGPADHADHAHLPGRRRRRSRPGGPAPSSTATTAPYGYARTAGRRQPAVPACSPTSPRSSTTGRTAAGPPSPTGRPNSVISIAKATASYGPRAGACAGSFVRRGRRAATA